ncbi:MAG: hypothetical protein MUC96_16405 [Myxococcaceae bacterium]|jgi:hypothetical protein|nr:hypothetical protein [Myxococcaceae bacterium]
MDFTWSVFRQKVQGMHRLLVLAGLLLVACGAPTSGLRTGTYVFGALRGREAAPSATVSGSTLELDVLTREVKLTLGGATRRFTMAQDATTTTGCPGNFGGTAQETRTLDAPNIQLGELLIDAPVLRTDCPAGSPNLVLQSGPVSAAGAAPDCSAEVICVVYSRR